MNRFEKIQHQRSLEIEWRRRTNNVLLLSLLLLRNNNYSRTYTPKRFWIRDIYKNRKEQGAYHQLLNEMRLSDTEKYFNYLRMSSDSFNNLLTIVGPKLTKLYCVREPISSGERLAVTLRYLASGDSMVSLSYAFRIGQSTLSSIILETCNFLWECLSSDVLCTPNKATWLNIANNFNERWQLPHCVGAIDGKHVIIQAPPNSGSTFFNYKGSHSIVLLAMCDAKYRFTLVDIGSEGRHSDGGIFKNSNMGRCISENLLEFPAPSVLVDGEDPINYYIVADEAFPLSTYIMRPYPGRFLTEDKRIFNYRLSRGRRVIENAFGILASRWRIYRNAIIASQPTVISIVKATICLHNFVMNIEENSEKHRYCSATSIDREDEAGDLIEGDWRKESTLNLLPINRIGTNMYGRAAGNMREHLKDYFMGDGAVPFQWNK